MYVLTGVGRLYVEMTKANRGVRFIPIETRQEYDSSLFFLIFEKNTQKHDTMKKLLLILSVALGALLCSSCATTSFLNTTPSAVINQANFHVVGPIQKEISCKYIFGFGGEEKKLAMENAILEMTEELGPNQALAYINTVESYKVPIFPIVITNTTTISAVIIEYDN